MTIYKLILKFIWKDKRLKAANTILKDKKKPGGLTLPDFKITIKLQKSRQCGTGERTDMDQENRIEIPEVEPNKYSQLIFEKEQKPFN